MDKRITITVTITALASTAGLAAILLMGGDGQMPPAASRAQGASEVVTARAAAQGPVDVDYQNELTSNLTTLADRVSRLQRQVASLEHRLEQRSVTEPVAEFTALPRIQDDPYLTEFEAPDGALGLDPQQEMNIEIRFEEQAVETAWSAAASDAIMRAVEQSNLPRSSVMALSCRSSICRAEVDALDPEQRQDFLRNLPLKFGGDMLLDEVYATYEKDDPTGSMVLHMSFADQDG
ncbi:MAG: hypothetical protein N838_31385 [Thiohalocapsa sp. PB-PSB1]|jgi:hypothetical protein|nr:MAG: hypothetical protein N838_31385 [Thiohalocapsa sp. PB-PSB1]